MNSELPIIGLFGTCGKSTWRNEFISAYNDADIKFFNPQVPDGTWTPGCIETENTHLMTDDIILFPVTSETTGQGSLAEIGFSISAALSRNPERYFIFLIDDECNDPDATPAQIKESNRTRALVKSKIKQMMLTNTGIYLVSTLSQMLKTSLQLHDIVFYHRNIKQLQA